ncbi:predicted protein [Postia placenta Mad-698-R]|nr:predicted protein [Postia placenta Mad-698-R]
MCSTEAFLDKFDVSLASLTAPSGDEQPRMCAEAESMDTVSPMDTLLDPSVVYGGGESYTVRETSGVLRDPRRFQIHPFVPGLSQIVPVKQAMIMQGEDSTTELDTERMSVHGEDIICVVYDIDRPSGPILPTDSSALEEAADGPRHRTHAYHVLAKGRGQPQIVKRGHMTVNTSRITHSRRWGVVCTEYATQVPMDGHLLGLVTVLPDGK